PTYMIFGESTQPAKWKRDPDFDRRDLYIITQNALADGFYEKYIRDHYGVDRPTAQNAFERWLGRDKQYPPSPLIFPTKQESEVEAKAMVEEKHVSKPEEMGTLYHSAVAKLIFELNKKDHEFFVEESFPMEWSYPYAVPHGLVYRINPEPLESLPKDVVEKDFAFWNDYIKKLTSNPMYFQDYDAQRSFSKLRVTMGRIYSFRKMKKEAERALMQSLELWPDNLEALSVICELLWERGEYEKPIKLLAKAASDDPDDISVLQMAEVALRREKLQSQIAAEEYTLKRNPKDRETFKKLMDDYILINNTNRFPDLLVQGKKNFGEDREILERVAQYYCQQTNYHMAQQTIEQLTQVEPKNPLHWFELSRVAMYLGNTNAALVAAKKAIDEGGLTYRQRIQNEVLYEKLRSNPEFQSLLGIPVRNDSQNPH
ncbi:MAG: tetratricopeptide repeat protein, partial [Chthoniobacterales bacterium]